MTEELNNKVKLYWEEYYLKDENFKLFDQLFTEQEVYSMFCCQEECMNLEPCVSSLLELLEECDYSFKGDYVFNEIMKRIDDMKALRRSNFAYYLDKLSDEQAYEVVKRCKIYKLEEAHYVVERVVLSIDSDEMKERILKEKLLKNIYVHNICRLVKSIKDDNIKIRCLKYVEKYDRVEVISSIKSDYLKTKYLTLFAKEKGDLICSLEDDKLRERQLRKYWFSLSGEYKGQIIRSFENPELVYKYARKVTSDSGKVPIISKLLQLNDRKTAIEIFSTVKSQKYIADGARCFGCKDDVYPYVSKLRTDEYIIEVMRAMDTDSSLRYISLLKHCSSSNIYKYLKNEWFQDYLPFLMAAQIKNFKQIEMLIDHLEEFPEYDERALPLILRYAENYNVNRDRLVFFVSTMGYPVLKYIKSNNVQKFLNLDEESFEKVMQIFDVQNLSFNDASFNDSVNALLQRKFRVQVPEIVMIFPTALQAIEQGNKKELGEMLDVLEEQLPGEVYDDKITNKEMFVDMLIVKNDFAIEKLHTLTSKFIKLKRNEYVRVEYDDIKNKTMNSSYDVKKSIKAFISIYPVGYIVHCISSKAIGYNRRYYSEEELALMDDKERLINIINYRKDPVANKDLLPLVKGDFKLFDTVCENVIDGYKLDCAAEATDVPPTYKFSEPNKEILFSFFSELDVDKMKDGILTDDEMFNSMIAQIKQYSLLGWIGTLDSIACESGIPVDSGLIANFIAYYPAIYKELKERYDSGMISSMTFTSFLDYAACFDSGSKRYSLLFGADNYSLIASNPQHNSSSSSKEERIAEALRYFKIIKTRKYVSVPPVEQDIELDGGKKKINVNVGNISNSINLTYGERTGACMRVLGAGKTLFDFCLKDENGFHVRFSDPETGEFVSRVSGFRNGNTVFLNQLRYSVSGKYNDQDIYHACEEFAKVLVEKSRGSVTPIDNVVICADMVMSKSGKPVVNLGVTNIKQGLSNSTFYSDVGSAAILLASSSSDGSLVPLKLGAANNKDRYDVLRERPRMYLENAGVDKIQCMEVTDQYLSGVAIEDFKVREIDDLLFSYVGEDWYIYVDKNKNIHKYIMNNSLNKVRAEEELAHVLEEINSKIELINESTMKM